MQSIQNLQYRWRAEDLRFYAKQLLSLQYGKRQESLQTQMGRTQSWKVHVFYPKLQGKQKNRTYQNKPGVVY